MSKCENCIHYECCCDWVSSEDLKDLGTGENCATFKDKSLFVELPCKVGDILYWSPRNEPCPYKVTVIKFRRKDILIETKSQYTGANVVFYATEIGKTVFLTKEEAEEKLKEIE